MDFRPTDAHTVLRRTVREFAERDIAPHVMEWDEAQVSLSGDNQTGLPFNVICKTLSERTLSVNWVE